MNKKLVSMVTALAVGGTMLIGTAAFALSQSSGYNVYKAAVKGLPDLKDATVNANVKVTDNGNVLLSGTDITKFDKDNKAMSTVSEFKLGGKDVKIESYQQDGKQISKAVDSDVYTVREGFGGKGFEKKTPENNTAVKQGFEGLFDAYIGNRSNNFDAKDNGDGSKTVSIKLGENDITPLDNAIVSFALKASGNERSFEKRQEASMADIKALVPQLVDEIKITGVDAKAVINADNTFINQTADITISGKDANGTDHTVVINATVDLSNVGSTTPDKIDLTGKQVNTNTFGDKVRGHRK